MLDHCKECPDCAERLLDAVRKQPLDTPRVALSMWNWISIGLLLLTLPTIVAVLWWISRNAAF